VKLCYQNFDKFRVFRIQFFVEDDGLLDEWIFNPNHVENRNLKFQALKLKEKSAAHDSNIMRFILESVSQIWTDFVIVANSYLGVQAPKKGIPKLGVSFFIALATG